MAAQKMKSHLPAFHWFLALLLLCGGGWMIWRGLPRAGYELLESSPVCRTSTTERNEALVPPTTPKGEDQEPLSPEAQATRAAAQVQLREAARQRVEQIRAVQEQLRAGAQPGEVKEPEGGN